MKFTYVYRSGDGRRLTEEIESPTRDEAFAALRAMGIRPIKVTAADGSRENGAPQIPSRRPLVFAALSAAALALAAAIFLAVRRDRGGVSAAEPEGAIRTAAPLPRQAIPGDRDRVIAATEAIGDPLARYLANFAEPGREIASGAALPDDGTVRSSLSVPLRYPERAHTEQIDLLRIVAGLKAELSGYLARGGSAADYAAELVKRQRLEATCRKRAERRLGELLEASDRGDAPRSERLREAYEYWLQANGQLQAMGIYTLPVPDRLREYQLTLEFDSLGDGETTPK